MGNSISLVTKFQPLLDEVYANATLTGDLESNAVQFDGSQTVKVLKLTVPALGNYTRNSGYTAGDVDAAWEAFTLTQDRGREFSVDAMDNEETLNLTFGKASSEFIRTKVVPEVDAYRFAKIAGNGNAVGTLSAGADVIAAINAAMVAMDDDEVTAEGRILYITPTNKALIDALDLTKSKAIMDRFAKVVVVPQTRFYSKVTIGDSGYSKTTASEFSATGDGSTTEYTISAKPYRLDSVKVDGTAKTEGTDYTYDNESGKITFTSAPGNTKAIKVLYGAGRNLNFEIVDPNAVFGIAKHTKLRAFDPDSNQSADAWKFQYRIYHDMFVYENKVAGVYSHIAEA